MKDRAKIANKTKKEDSPHKRGEIPRNPFFKILEYYRKRIVYKFFWGRGNLYKASLHAAIGIVTFTILVSGLVNRFESTNASTTFEAETLASGNVDLLEQGSSVQSLLATQNIYNFEIITHKVEKGESLDDIANKYGVTKRTILDSNREVTDFYEETIEESATLKIPEIDGVLYVASENDDIDSILEKTEGGTRWDIIELNSLRQPDYTITANQEIIIPGATLPPPDRPQPVPTYIPPAATPPANPGTIDAPVATGSINGVAFSSPVAHPSCGGWVYQRGFTAWHNGIDLSRGGGCILSASAAGVVTYAGWSNGGEGFLVVIDHGNGIQSLYFHGSGEFYVGVGDYVAQGQSIMYMGSTGFSTGTHVHFSVKQNGIFIDPAPYTTL